MRALALLSLLSLPAFAESELGAVLPDSAHKVAEHRFKSGTDWESTLKFYKSALPPANYPRKAIVNQPGVKAVHISNPSGRGSWEGLNVYESGDEVRIFVVPTGSTSAIRPKPKSK
jgi:hypothetical protein